MLSITPDSASISSVSDIDSFLKVFDKEITTPLNPESLTNKFDPEPVIKIGIYLLDSLIIRFYLLEKYTLPPPKVVLFIDSFEIFI